MRKSVVRNGLVVALSAVFVGCPDAKKLSDRTFKNLGDEQSSYQRFVEVNHTDNTQSLKHLLTWAQSLSDLNASVEKIAERVRNNAEERVAVSSDLSMLRTMLDEILARVLDVEIWVPSWEHQSASDTVQGIYRTMENLKDNYRKLYGVVGGESRIRMSTAIDERFYDTYNDCVERFRLATMADSESNTCIEKARQLCGHQMDLKRIDRLIVMSLPSALQDGYSVCIKREYRHIVDMTDPEAGHPRVVEIESAEPWLDDIAKCVSDTPVYR